MSTLTWLHLSDWHWREADGYDANVVMGKLLDDLADRARFAPEIAKINLILVTGDIAFAGCSDDYALARRFLKRLRQVTRVRKNQLFMVPGNHDVRWSPLGMQVFRRHLGEPHQARKENGLLVVALDSTVPLSHWGHYEKSQLNWLREQLEAAGRDTPVVLATHHWVGWGSMMVDNENELLEVIRRDRGYGDDAGRKMLLQVFNLLGNEGELVAKYRRLLASAMY